jgi:quercetin dioxygenase-like cupin family protein
MKIFHTEKIQTKGWHTGPWNSSLPLAIGYANQAIDEPHDHKQVVEIYLVARGSVTLHVDKKTRRLASGDVVILEPGEARTFTDSSEDYLLFVIHTPGLEKQAMAADKITVDRGSVMPGK